MLATKRSFLPFQIHITDETENVYKLSELSIRTITIDLLKPDFSLIRSEHMTSYDIKISSLDMPIYVFGLTKMMMSYNCKISRVKIETAPFEDLFEQSLYIESHFNPTPDDYKKYAISRNQKTGEMLGTDREYDKSKYKEFIKKWNDKTEEIELCIFDTNPGKDKDWLDYVKQEI